MIGGVSASKAAVNSISADDVEIVAEDYYNLNGIRVEKPTKGIFIRRIILTDGSERYTKAYFNP